METETIVSAAAAARENEASCRAILDALGDAVVVHDAATGEIREVNRKFCELLGYSPEEARRLNIRDLAGDGQYPRETSVTGQPGLHEWQIKDRSGRQIWVEAQLSRAVLQGGEQLCMVLRDISPRQQVEANRAEIESFAPLVMEGALAGVYLIQDEKFRYVNLMMAQKFGYRPEEIIDRFGPLDLVQPEDREIAAANLRRRLSGEETIAQYCLRGRHRDGSTIHCEILSRYTEYRERPAVLGILLDITERKQAEEALEVSEANYRTIFNAVDEGIAVVDLETGSFIDVNQKWCRMTGFSQEEARGLQVAALCLNEPPFTGADALHWIKAAASQGPQSFEYRAKTKEGRRHWVEINLRRTVIGGQHRLLAVIRDVTERKQAEEALRTSEAKYRHLVEQIPAITYIAALDNLSAPIYISPQTEAILGFTPEEFLSDPELYKNRIHPEDRDRVLTELLLSYSQGGPFTAEYRMLSKSSRVVWIQDESRAVFDSRGRPLFVQGVAMDITKRKKSEEALRAANSKLNALVQAVPLAIVSLDLQRKVISWNPAAERIFGWPQEEVIGRPYVIEPEEEMKEFKRLWQRLLQGEPLLGLELRRLKKDGSQIDVSLSTAPLYDAAGGFAGAIGIFEDITARKRAEKAAEEIRRQQEAILSNISDIAWMKDRETRYIVVNEQYSLACGVPPQEVVGKTDLEIWPRNLALKYRADDQEVMRSGQRKRLEETVVDRKGKIFWMETIKTPIFNERQEVIGTAGIARDITERRRMEEALRQVSRALKAVTECHQALLRATNEAELLNEVCRIIVQVGGYPMAWVGYARQDAGKSVEPMAHKGFETGYMQTLRVTWADTERGWGPVGTAIRTGKPAITRDTQSDPRFAPWRAEAHKRGFASVLALPLKETEAFGALAIYAAEPNAFDDEEINLLIGLANDLAFGLKILRTGAERRRAEEALRESETKYRSLMDEANDAIVLADSRGKITEVNRKAVELLGYPETELLGMNFIQIHPTRILDHVTENFKVILASGRGPLHECLVRRKDGEEVPVDITHNMVETGDHGVVQAVFRDITERQRAQEALRDSEQKLRLLASKLLAVQETERRRISRELHDELGQALTVLKIHLVALENRLRGDQEDLKASCEHLQNYIDAVIENVRRLSRDLSPSILEDLGLSSSLRHLIEEICRNNQMLYTVTMDEIDPLFSPEAKINIYRIFQESLTNIVRHAEASRIEVKINKEKDRVTFRLKDDGKGFDLKKVRSRKLEERGLGLTAMHERALMADGTLNLRSRKGRGTEITLTIPIKKQGELDVSHSPG